MWGRMWRGVRNRRRPRRGARTRGKRRWTRSRRSCPVGEGSGAVRSAFTSMRAERETDNARSGAPSRKEDMCHVVWLRSHRARPERRRCVRRERGIDAFDADRVNMMYSHLGVGGGADGDGAASERGRGGRSLAGVATGGPGRELMASHRGGLGDDGVHGCQTRRYGMRMRDPVERWGARVRVKRRRVMCVRRNDGRSVSAKMDGNQLYHRWLAQVPRVRVATFKPFIPNEP